MMPDPRSYDLVGAGTPIYYEHPMSSVIEFIEENDGLYGCRVVVFITCFAASRRIPAPIRNAVIRRYLGLVLKHIRGEVVASRAFKGWLRRPDGEVLESVGSGAVRSSKNRVLGTNYLPVIIYCKNF